MARRRVIPSLRQPHIVELEQKNSNRLIIATPKQDSRVFGPNQGKFSRAPDEIAREPTREANQSAISNQWCSAVRNGDQEQVLR
jgi:hypothetical protein